MVAAPQAPAAELPSWWFRNLKVGHDPKDPPEATLVLGATAAINGVRCDGEPMEGDYGEPASLQGIARQLCLPISAVRRGFYHLRRVGAVYVDGGVRVRPEALRDRWANHRQRLSISTEARHQRMRPRALLLTGLVAGQVDERGQLRLGIGFLMERTGFSKSALHRALDAARRRKAIHTWKTPPRWQLFLALGPSRNGTRRESPSGTRRGDKPPRDEAPKHSEQRDRHEAGPSTITNRHRPHHEAGPSPSRSGTRPPDSPGLPPVSPTDSAPASPAGETRAAPAPNPEPSNPQKSPHEVQAAIDAWVKRHADTVSFDSGNAMEVAEVATLIDAIGPRPAVVRDLRAFARDRLALARGVIGWCPFPDRLGRWLVRAFRWFGVQNLGAYLRRACEKGRPGTLLESHSKNVLGRAAETWQDFSPKTERTLRGPRSDDIQKLVASVAGVFQTLDESERAEIRADLARYWKQKRPTATRFALLRLLGDDHSDAAIARETDGILTFRQAKLLLAGVA